MVHGIVVLDGPDATGKSTLAKRFQGEHNAIVIHATNRWLGKMWQYHNAILLKAIHLAFKEKRLVVLDRHWASEQAYASVFRNGGPTPRAGRLFDRVLRRFGAVYINCLPNSKRDHLELYLKNRDPQHDYKIDAFKRVVQAYHDMWWGLGPERLLESTDELTPLHDDSYGRVLALTGGCMHRWDTLPYDMFKHDMESTIGFALGKLNDRPKFIYQWAKDPALRNLSGCVDSAEVVMVGDVLNPKKFRNDRHEAWPFHDYQHSSLFLLQSLDQSGIREEQLCWVNANHLGKRSEAVMLKVLSDCCPHLRAVSFGVTAHKKCETVGLRSIMVPHPSFASRFGVANYPQILKGAVDAAINEQGLGSSGQKAAQP